MKRIQKINIDEINDLKQHLYNTLNEAKKDMQSKFPKDMQLIEDMFDDLKIILFDQFVYDLSRDFQRIISKIIHKTKYTEIIIYTEESSITDIRNYKDYLKIFAKMFKKHYRKLKRELNLYIKKYSSDKRTKEIAIKLVKKLLKYLKQNGRDIAIAIGKWARKNDYKLIKILGRIKIIKSNYNI